MIYNSSDLGIDQTLSLIHSACDMSLCSPATPEGRPCGLSELVNHSRNNPISFHGVFEPKLGKAQLQNDFMNIWNIGNIYRESLKSRSQVW